MLNQSKSISFCSFYRYLLPLFIFRTLFFLRTLTSCKRRGFEFIVYKIRDVRFVHKMVLILVVIERATALWVGRGQSRPWELEG